MEGEPMREKTYHIYLNEEERSRVIQSLIELKNNLSIFHRTMPEGSPITVSAPPQLADITMAQPSIKKLCGDE